MEKHDNKTIEAIKELDEGKEQLFSSIDDLMKELNDGIPQMQIELTKEGKWFVAKDIVSEVASQGTTAEEAIWNLKEAVELYYEGTKD